MFRSRPRRQRVLSAPRLRGRDGMATTARAAQPSAGTSRGASDEAGDRHHIDSAGQVSDDQPGYPSERPTPAVRGVPGTGSQEEHEREERQPDPSDDLHHRAPWQEAGAGKLDVQAQDSCRGEEARSDGAAGQERSPDVVPEDAERGVLRRDEAVKMTHARSQTGREGYHQDPHERHQESDEQDLAEEGEGPVRTGVHLRRPFLGDWTGPVELRPAGGPPGAAVVGDGHR